MAKKTPLKKYLVEHDVTMGTENMLYVSLFSVVEATNHEEATNIVANYGDPAFKIRVKNITELENKISAADLYKLMAHHKVVKTNPLLNSEDNE